MARFPTGADAILASAEAAKGGGKKFSPELFWRDGDERYIQFITPLNQIQTVPVYNVKVGVTQQGKPIMRTLIDPRPVEGKDAYNPLADRWGLEPRTKQIAVAVELEPVFESVKDKNGNVRNKRTGFKVMERTFTYQKGDRAGEEVSVPNVGLIINTHLFFKYLTTWEDDKGDITLTPFKVKRVGGDKNTTYNFIPYENDAVELSEDVLEAVNLDDYVDMLMSAARYHELIDPLPDEWVPDRFAAARQNAKGQTRPVVETPVAEDSDSDSDIEPEEENDAAQKKFNDLRARYG